MMDRIDSMIVTSLNGTALRYMKFLIPSRIRMIPIMIQKASTKYTGLTRTITPKAAMMAATTVKAQNLMPSSFLSRRDGTKIMTPSRIRNTPVILTSMIIEFAG